MFDLTFNEYFIANENLYTLPMVENDK